MYQHNASQIYQNYQYLEQVHYSATQAQESEPSQKVQPYKATILDFDSKFNQVRSLAWQKRFWVVVLALIAIPTVNSFSLNMFSLVFGVSENVKLHAQKASLEKDKNNLETKLQEFNSQSGLKRAIKEQINLVESNEIVVKIVD